MEDPKLIDEFINFLSIERGLSGNTQVSYRLDLNGYASFLKKRGSCFKSCSPDDVMGFLRALQSGGQRTSTIARKLVAVKMLHRFLVNEGYAGSDPTAFLDPPRKEMRLPSVLRREEVEAVLGAPDASKPAGVRDRELLELLYATGMRVSEAADLRVEDLNLKGGFIRCFGKGGKERIVPVGRHAVEATEQYLSVRVSKCRSIKAKDIQHPASPPRWSSGRVATSFSSGSSPGCRRSPVCASAVSCARQRRGSRR